ncbi:hypothetical protein VNI00_007841 [Paramarasmius palmivorus]|uniref:C2 domain-containing protein n=1 Tax=Paramarasmius palmivorus TaxID=297713 RepID=A0AAW0CVE6_9AGAR
MSDEEIGTLIVVILKARNLNDKHFYKQDVYATISLNGVKKSTKVDLKGGQHPVWDDELRFPVMKNDSTKFRTLEAACWSKEHKDDDLLGEGKVDISDTLKSGEFDEWVPLQVNGVARGDIYLEMTYYSNGPAPERPADAPVSLNPAVNLTRRPSKLAPADRLWRPPQGHTPPQSYSNLPNHAPVGAPMGPPTPPKSSPKGRYSGLPPQNEAPPPAVPDLLKPGLNHGHKRSSSQPQSHLSPSPPSTSPQRVPTILRPANPKAAPESTFSRHSSVAPSITPSVPDPGYSRPASSIYPQNSVSSIPTYPQPSVHSHSPAPSAHNTYRPPSAIPVEHWNAPHAPHTPQHPPSHPSVPPVSFSFPVPDVSNAPLSPPPITSPPVQSPYDSMPPGGFYEPPRQHSPMPPPHLPHSHSLPQSQSQSYPHPHPHPHHTSSYHSDFPTQTQSEESLPDPYLIARYQSPLPLPPGVQPPQPAKKSSPPPPPPHPHEYRSRSSSRSPPSHSPPPPARTTPPPPPADKPVPSLPVPAQPPAARQPTPLNEERLRVLREAEERAARRREQEERDAELARQLDRDLQAEQERNPPPPPPPKTPEEDTETIARRLEAEAEARRKEQEERDLELARQLDRELNLDGDDIPTPPRMPGGI